ncbi:hemerythrin domain-containing protein [Bdellovibrio sp. SKB1291214]|uniref:hemerythrin domain-containing protein n=1 Tax=Bdellovibrio sp. SKB1291214 TaxID=1732569 RepID=UPI000B517542|nr:hemerythrin domain-containing protein [Bdellovibrio sp. SKB1291214]UYL07381.1 hemerythrin domain-containing protein [Bdellovibrio sp. SKB1291214]
MAVRKIQSNPEDIVQLILNDHILLKQLIEIMKSDDADFRVKKAAFEKFAPALIAHAKPEEQTLYIKMKEEDHTVEGLEGDVEHALADQLCEELKRTTDRDMFMAKVKVLAELVEHHIEEEEEEMLPEFKHDIPLEERVDLGMQYLQLQGELDAQGDTDSPSERSLNL